MVYKQQDSSYFLQKEPCMSIRTISKAGFQREVNEQVLKAKVDQPQENRKYCALLFDEMKVKENLVYDKYTGIR